jgi:hypothetical protein
MTNAPTQTARDWLGSVHTSLLAWWMPKAKPSHIRTNAPQHFGPADSDVLSFVGGSVPLTFAFEIRIVFAVRKR